MLVYFTQSTESNRNESVNKKTVGREGIEPIERVLTPVLLDIFSLMGLLSNTYFVNKQNGFKI